MQMMSDCSSSSSGVGYWGVAQGWGWKCRCCFLRYWRGGHGDGCGCSFAGNSSREDDWGGWARWGLHWRWKCGWWRWQDRSNRAWLAFSPMRLSGAEAETDARVGGSLQPEVARRDLMRKVLLCRRVAGWDEYRWSTGANGWVEGQSSYVTRLPGNHPTGTVMQSTDVSRGRRS